MNLGQKYASSNDQNLYKRNVNPNLMGMSTQFRNLNNINSNDVEKDLVSLLKRWGWVSE